MMVGVFVGTPGLEGYSESNANYSKTIHGDRPAGADFVFFNFGDFLCLESPAFVLVAPVEQIVGYGSCRAPRRGQK